MFYQHNINQVKGMLFLQALFGNDSRTYNADRVRVADTYNQGDGLPYDALNLDHSSAQEPKFIMFDMQKGTYLEVDQNGQKNYFTLNGFERSIAKDGHGTPMNVMGTNETNRIITGDANDTIQGRGGYNFLDGCGGDDLVIGGSADDWVKGGEGIDRLYGGGGEDTFVMVEGDGYDVIKDFVDGEDKLWIRSAGNLSIRDIGADSQVWRNGDLLAVVEGAAGDLEIGAGGITVI